MSAQISSLGSITLADTQLFGSKAAALGDLIAAALPVPRGIAISADAIRDVPPYELSTAITTAITEAGLVPPFAVRSSAAAEDQTGASYAGQFRSELDVPLAGVVDAVLRCSKSASSENVATYEQARGLAHQPVLISVIIQEQVAADLAGVLFTVDPVTGDSGVTVVELVRGLGDKLMSGLAEPVQVRIDGVDADIANAPSWLDEAVRTRVLRLAPALRAVGSTTERHFGAPQDVEFCVTADDEIVIVQSRPITTLPQTSTANYFDVSSLAVEVANAEAIPDEVRALDKVRLRLIASESGLRVGRGWLLQASKIGSAPPHRLSLPPDLVEADQVSFVLQVPARLDGNIVRRFSSREGREAALDGVLQVVGRAHHQFTLIGTEILRAELSGMARALGGTIVVEVGYGSFVPKGVVVTSQYVCDMDGTVRNTELNLQPKAVLIVDGESRVVNLDKTPELTPEQCAEVCRSVAAASRHYASPSVEFGITSKGEFFLIDMVDETTSHTQEAPSDLRVISPGAVRGRVVKIVDDSDLLTSSLDAHFHTERSDSEQFVEQESLIVAAPLPYLSLESFIRGRPSSKIGFVFRSCSYLSHLSIVMRELGVVAVVDPDWYGRLTEGVEAAIDTALPGSKVHNVEDA